MVPWTQEEHECTAKIGTYEKKIKILYGHCKLRPFEGSRTFRLTFCLGRVYLGDPYRASHRQSLGDCAIGFGRNAVGGQNGQIYIVTDNSDDDVMNPNSRTLRWGAIQNEAAVDHLPARHADRAERGADHEQFQDLGRKRRERAHSGTCLLDDSTSSCTGSTCTIALRFYGTCHYTQHSGACQVQSSVGRVSQIPFGITQISPEHFSPIFSGHRHE
jgi:hypothetical protein